MKQLLWLDIETTGTNEEKDHILEIGGFATNEQLEIIAPEFDWVLSYKGHPHPVDQIVIDMHFKTGLWVEANLSKIQLSDVTTALIAFMQMYNLKKPVLAGFSPHFDRRFLHHLMPEFEGRNLHHRNFDVSTIREAVKVWAPNVVREPLVVTHRALADCRAAHNLALYYKDQLFDVANRFLEGSIE